MRTKEEILKKKVGNVYYENNAITTSEALDSMQEYADEQSIAFAEWMILNNVEFYDNTDDGDIYLFNGLHFRTLPELLQIFKKENTKP